MKKTFLLFMIALFVVSCEGPEGPQGYGTNWKIIDLTIKSSDWTENIDKDGLNRYYSCNFNIPEIDATVYNDGTVNSYIITGASQQVLPSVLHLENLAGERWTQTIDYDFSEGSLNVYLTNSDFADYPPGDMKIRVVLMW